MRFLGGCFSLLVATQILRDGGLFSVIPLLINCSSNSYLSFCFIASFAFVLQKASGKAHAPTVARPKAPSGRELPTESGEGECVTMKLVQI